LVLEPILGALLIMVMRIADVTIGTARTIQVVNGRKYLAGLAGFFEVLIWIFAMSYIVKHLDHTGFGLGNIIGITIEQRIGLGFLQLSIISKYCTDKIADELRKSKCGVTIIPGEGGRGGVAIIIVIIKRKSQREIIKLVESIDPHAFISVQPSIPYRGYIHGARK
jgi:uncharacterized protein YebE (UPF0316 family)